MELTQEQMESIVQEVQLLRAEGDAHMAKRKFNDAEQCYGQAWAAFAPNAYDDEEGFWLLMSLLDANFERTEYDGAMEVLGIAFRNFGEQAIGNPYFHLRAGQLKFCFDPQSNDTGPGSAFDELARALIGGGIELFDDEKDHWKKMITDILPPPNGYRSWEETRGKNEAATRDKLASATGYPASLIKKRIPDLIA